MHTQRYLPHPRARDAGETRKGFSASSCLEVLLLQLLRKLEFAEAELKPDSLDSIPVSTVRLSDSESVVSLSVPQISPLGNSGC